MLCHFHNIAFSYLCFLIAFESVAGFSFRRNHAQTNLVFVLFDDLRLEMFHYGRKYMKTPNFDRLASKSVTFDNAYCQIAVCNPSRDSLLTGLRPDTVGTYGFQHSWAPHILLPQQLMHSNYHTAGYGKLLHWDSDSRDIWSVESWQGDWFGYQNSEGRRFMNASVHPDNILKEDEFRDHIITTHALSGLDKLRNKSNEDNSYYMLSIGYKLPHTALHIPLKYFNLYKDLNMWGNGLNTTLYPKDAPIVGYRCCALGSFAHMRNNGASKSNRTSAIGGVNNLFPPEARNEIMRGYAAAVSFVDSQLGRLLDRIDELSLWDNITVVLTADHGMHNGEKGIWDKWTLFDESTRVPLMIYHPLSPFKGQHFTAPVELVDVYPTVIDLLQAPFINRKKVCKTEANSGNLMRCIHNQGKSLAPVILGPNVWSSTRQKVNAKQSALLGATEGQHLRLKSRTPVATSRKLESLLDFMGKNSNVPEKPADNTVVATLRDVMEKYGFGAISGATPSSVPNSQPGGKTNAFRAPMRNKWKSQTDISNVNEIVLSSDFALSQMWRCASEKQVMQMEEPYTGKLRGSQKHAMSKNFWNDCDMTPPKQGEIQDFSVMGYSMRTLNYRYTAWVRFNLTTLTPEWSKDFTETENGPGDLGNYVVAVDGTTVSLPTQGIVYEELYDHVGDTVAHYTLKEYENIARNVEMSDVLVALRRRLLTYLKRHVVYAARVS